MKVKFSLELCRQLTKSSFEEYINAFEFPDENTIHEYLDSMYDFAGDNSEMNKYWYTSIASLLFIDGFKMLNYKKVNGKLNDDEKEVMKKIDNFVMDAPIKDLVSDEVTKLMGKILGARLSNDSDSKSALQKLFDDDRDVLHTLGDLAFEYMEIPEIERYMIVRSLKEEDNLVLSLILPPHQLEYNEYKKSINADQYIPLYQNLIAKEYSVKDANDKIVEFMQFVARKDNRSYLGVFKDMAQTHYKWNKYLAGNYSTLVSEKDKEIMNGLEEFGMDFYANHKANKSVLKPVFDSYRKYKDGNYSINHNEIQATIYETNVNRNLFNNTSDEILTKLKFEKPIEKKKSNL